MRKCVLFDLFPGRIWETLKRRCTLNICFKHVAKATGIFCTSFDLFQRRCIHIDLDPGKSMVHFGRSVVHLVSMASIGLPAGGRRPDLYHRPGCTLDRPKCTMDFPGSRSMWMRRRPSIGFGPSFTSDVGYTRVSGMPGCRAVDRASTCCTYRPRGAVTYAFGRHAAWAV